MSLESCLIIGVGNPHRGDDGVGPRVIEELRSVLPASVRMETHDGEPASLMELWQTASTVILVDAVLSGAAPGKVFRLNLEETSFPDTFRQHSTHGFGVAEAVALGRVMGRLPERLLFFGVEIDTPGWGAELSPGVEAGLKEVVRRLPDELAGF